MAQLGPIYQVAVPSPLYRYFDYLPPLDQTGPIAPGARVRVPFGRGSSTVGIVLGTASESSVPASRLKRIDAVLDSKALLPADMLAMLCWAADYYHHPIGEVLATALPAWLRSGRSARATAVEAWRATALGQSVDMGTLKRAPLQRKLLESLRQASDGVEAQALSAVSRRWRDTLRALERNGLAERYERTAPVQTAPAALPATSGAALNEAQRSAVSEITGGLGKFHPCLLHGITGSGKTEVYLGAMDAVLARHQQVLVLVPEIGLTPQLVARFQKRLGLVPAVLHSGLTDAQRFEAWRAAAEQHAPLVIGTRSAVFTPMPRLGLIVVDEEHDPSFKQQDGFRYSARDLAVLRASREGLPVVLGSATPSLESLRRAKDGSYRLLELPERPGVAELPTIRVLDMRRLPADDGLSPPLRAAVAERLARGEQSLLFLNRRGFSPVLMCYDCGWIAPCRRCDARQTLHHRLRKLVCHHCGSEQPLPVKCPQCGGSSLHPIGEGTERLEAAMARYFPNARIVRIDRDSAGGRGQLEEKLASVHAGRADILVGTQMLTKGHDFPNVTLVGVINADQGLYSADFRASERMFQQVLQVAGRAGRAEKPGEVMIQTWHPDHPIFAALMRHDFSAFAEITLAERRETGLPPYGYLALLRAESPHDGAALAFLRAACARMPPPAGVSRSAPAPAPMERRAGRWRAQVLVQSADRAPLQRFLRNWLPEFSELREARRVRWSLDVDPADLY